MGPAKCDIKKAVRVSSQALQKVGPHSIISLAASGKTIQFLKGKGSILKEKDSVILLFSSLKKPVKITHNQGRSFKPGPCLPELAEAYGLSIFEHKAPAEKPKPIPLDRRIDHIVQNLEILLKELPPSVPVIQLSNALASLKRIKEVLPMLKHRPPPGAFKNEVISAQKLKRR